MCSSKPWRVAFLSWPRARLGRATIVSVGRDGLLVDRHEPGELAAALARVLEDSQLRGRMAAEARRSATRFALPVIASLYDGVFRQVLA